MNRRKRGVKREVGGTGKEVLVTSEATVGPWRRGGHPPNVGSMRARPGM